MKIANAVRGVPFAEVKHGTIVQIFDTNSNLYIGVRGRWDAATRRPGEPPKRSKGGPVEVARCPIAAECFRGWGEPECNLFRVKQNIFPRKLFRL